VVAGEQHLGHRETAELGRTGVARRLEEAVGERFLVGRGRIAEDAGDEAGDRVDDRHRRHLAAHEDEVADRELLIDGELAHALVAALVGTADEDDARKRGEGADALLGERPPGRREKDAVRRPARGDDRLDGGDERLDAHHHPDAAAVGCIVDAAVAVGREVARIGERDPDEALLYRLAEKPRLQERAEHLREARDPLERHESCSAGKSSGSSTTRRRAAVSTERTNSGTAGRRRSRPSPWMTRIGCAADRTSFTTPISAPEASTTLQP